MSEMHVKRLGCARAILFAISVCTSSVAGAWSLTDAIDGWPEFLLGIASGIAIHEAGHVTLAKAHGYSVKYDGLSLTYPDSVMTGRRRLQIASAGFQAQWLASEFVFYREAQSPDSRQIGNLGAGIILSEVLVSLAYFTVLKDHEFGDITGIHEESGLSRDQLLLAIAVPAVIDAWRLIDDTPPRWLPRLAVASKGLLFGAIWSF